MIKAVNVLTDVELTFDANTDPRWAVAYGHCEEHNSLSWLFGMTQDGKAPQAYEKLGVLTGKRTVGCGDWVALV